jgi:hypothetical protein
MQALVSGLAKIERCDRPSMDATWLFLKLDLNIGAFEQ